MLPRPTTHSGAIGPGCAGPSMAQPGPALDHDRALGSAVQRPACGAEAFTVDPKALAAGGHKKHTTCVDASRGRVCVARMASRA